eukprot:6209664-Pleurochrysis_carterae.AAC.4
MQSGHVRIESAFYGDCMSWCKISPLVAMAMPLPAHRRSTHQDVTAAAMVPAARDVCSGAVESTVTSPHTASASDRQVGLLLGCGGGCLLPEPSWLRFPDTLPAWSEFCFVLPGRGRAGPCRYAAL